MAPVPACTLDPTAFRRRRDTLLPGLVRRAEAAEALPDGVRWRFTQSEGLLLALAGVIEAERRCCPFLRFQVVAESDEGPISLEVTGPAGTREFLESLFGR